MNNNQLSKNSQKLRNWWFAMRSKETCRFLVFKSFKCAGTHEGCCPISCSGEDQPM